MRTQVELAKELDLKQPEIAWHTVHDRIAEVGCFLGLVTGICGKIAFDVKLMMQTEVEEVFEPFHEGRGSSSTMPQKRNPISCVYITAQTGVVRSQVVALLNAMEQDHERATGQWEIEWIVLPEIFVLTAGCLAQTKFMMSGLQVDEKRMRANLDITKGLIVSEAVMMGLGPALGRQYAHDLVYDICRKVVATGRPLADLLAENEEIAKHMSKAELAEAVRPGELSRPGRRDGGPGAGDAAKGLAAAVGSIAAAVSRLPDMRRRDVRYASDQARRPRGRSPRARSRSCPPSDSSARARLRPRARGLRRFVQRLRELGWSRGPHGRDRVSLGERDDSERFAEIAAEFVRLKVDVIVTSGTANVARCKAGDVDYPDRVRGGRRPGRQRPRRKPGATRPQRHWPVGFWRPTSPASESSSCARFVPGLRRVLAIWPTLATRSSVSEMDEVHAAAASVWPRDDQT